MEHLISVSSDASATELRLFLRRLSARASDAALSKDEIDCIVAPASVSGPVKLERRARRLERLLAVAASLLGSREATSDWLRSPNPGLAGQTPLEAILGHEDALRAICAALIDEHRAVFPDGGW